MKCLSSFNSICFIIAAIFPAGQSINYYPIPLRYSTSDESIPSEPFCMVGLVASQHALGLARCFVDKVLENIEVYTNVYSGECFPSSSKVITDVKGEKKQLCDSTFALVTLRKKKSGLSDEIDPSIFPTQNDFLNFKTDTWFTLSTVDERYGSLENTPAVFLFQRNNYIAVEADSVSLTKPNWEGSPLYEKEEGRIVAVCESYEKSHAASRRVYCRTTENVYQTLVLPALDEEKRIAEEEKKKSKSLSNEKEDGAGSSGRSNRRQNPICQFIRRP